MSENPVLVETTGGMCEPVIERNATIPTEKSRVFATTQNNQTSVLIRIAQGESRSAAKGRKSVSRISSTDASTTGQSKCGSTVTRP